MADKAKKIIDQLDVGGSSSEADSKFDVEAAAAEEPDDLIENFKSIGQEYAGTGGLMLSPSRQREGASGAQKDGIKIPADDASRQPVAFHQYGGIDHDSSDDSDAQQPVTKPNVPQGGRNSNMQESMYAHALAGPGRRGKKKKKGGALKKPALMQDQIRTDNFSTISNNRGTAKSKERAKRNQNTGSLMSQQAYNTQALGQQQQQLQHQTLIPSEHHVQLETIDQWNFQPKDGKQSANNLGQSARLSKHVESRQGSVDRPQGDNDPYMQEYSTLQHVQSIKDRGTASGMRANERKKTLHESDQALADALRKNRRDASQDGDEIMDQMNAEMRQEMRDVNPLESAQKSRTIDAQSRRDQRAKLITPSKESAMKNKLKQNQGRKVKGMMGLAVHHNKNDVVDAVQLQALDADDLLGDDDDPHTLAAIARKKKGKAREVDDFGMSSDEEQQLEQRKEQLKQHEAQDAKARAEEERVAQEKRQEEINQYLASKADSVKRALETAQRQKREQEEKKAAEERRKREEKEAVERRKREKIEAEERKQREAQQAIKRQKEAEEAEKKAQEERAAAMRQAYSSGGDRSTSQLMQNKALAPIEEKPEENNENPGKRVDSDSPSLTLRSNQKLVGQSAEADRSVMMNADDSQAPIQEGVQKLRAQIKPSFLGRIGAMIGLMQNSEFRAPEKEQAPKVTVVEQRPESSQSASKQSRVASRQQSRAQSRQQSRAQSRSRSRQRDGSDQQDDLPEEPEIVSKLRSSQVSQGQSRQQIRQQDRNEDEDSVEEPQIGSKLRYSQQSEVRQSRALNSSLNKSREKPISAKPQTAKSAARDASPNQPPAHDTEPADDIGNPGNDDDLYQSAEKQSRRQSRIQSRVSSRKISRGMPSANGMVLEDDSPARHFEEIDEPRLTQVASAAAIGGALGTIDHGEDDVDMKPVREHQTQGRSHTPLIHMKQAPGNQSEVAISPRARRQQERLLIAAQTGKELNESYYDEVESEDNSAPREDPYDINHRQGYESSSTAHKEVSGAAAKLKRKVAQFSKDEVTTKGGSLDPLADSRYVDPERDETHALFKTNKLQLQQQGLSLKKSDYNQLHPHSGKQAVVDTLRFTGCFIYLLDLCVKIAYFKNTKWISANIRELWWQIFRLRIFFVLFYHIGYVIYGYERSYFEYRRKSRQPIYQRVQVQPLDHADTIESDQPENGQSERIEVEKVREEKRKLSRNTLQHLCEITAQAFILPFMMYTGFSRLAMLRDIKTNYLYVSLGQELILHQVPLFMLFYYNNEMVDKPDYKLDTATFYIALVHVGWVLLELTFQRSYLNKGVNLEQRIKMSPDVRVKDLCRLWIMAGLIAAVFILPAYLSFEKQECKPQYYQMGDYECHDCRNFHGEECMECVDNFVCRKCVRGHFLKDDQCHICAEQWPGCVDCIYYQTNTGRRELGKNQTPALPGPESRMLQSISSSIAKFGESRCIKQAHGYYFDRNGQIQSCKKLRNCVEGSCGDFGCTKCIEGYYLENSECKRCNIQGCLKCSSRYQCTECKSDFLQVVQEEIRGIKQGNCKCNIGNNSFPHMTQDRYGSCSCEEGYWLTELGCETCEGLIPGCEQCYRTSQNTLIPLYEGANVGRFSRQYYVDCRQCPYHDFRQRANAWMNEKPACLPCSTKWDGCGYCGTYGNRCTSCLPSHVYNQRNYLVPCRPCWCWMGRCIWCQGSTKCVKHWSPGEPWPDYDLSCK